MPNFQKAILQLGTKQSPDGSIDVTPSRLRHWEREFRRMRENGQVVPMHWDHGDDIESLSPLSEAELEKRQTRSAINTVGLMQDFRVSDDGASAIVTFETKTAAATEKLGQNAVFVSPVIFDQWRDGSGESYRDVITHLDIVDHPVDHAQGPAEPIEGVVGLSLRRMAAAHSPTGGVTIDGTFYPGGRFIPGKTQAEVDKAAGRKTFRYPDGKFQSFTEDQNPASDADNKPEPKPKKGAPVNHGDAGAGTGSQALDWMIERAKPMQTVPESLRDPVEDIEQSGIFEGKIPYHMTERVRAWAKEHERNSYDTRKNGIVYNVTDEQGRNYSIQLNSKGSRARVTWDHRGPESLIDLAESMKGGKSLAQYRDSILDLVREDQITDAASEKLLNQMPLPADYNHASGLIGKDVTVRLPHKKEPVNGKAVGVKVVSPGNIHGEGGQDHAQLALLVESDGKTIQVNPNDADLPPNEGDVNAKGLTFKDGRWRRLDDGGNEFAPGVSYGLIPRSAGYAAHAGSSFVPDERAEQESKGFAHVLNSDYAEFRRRAKGDPDKLAILEQEWPEYVDRNRAAQMAKLQADSRTISSMITGPSNFPTARNRKRLDTAHKRLEDAISTRDKGRKRMLRKMSPENAPKRIGDSDTGSHIDKKLASLEKRQEQMKLANKIVRQHVNFKETGKWSGDVKFRKGKSLETGIAALVDAGFSAKLAESLLTRDTPGELGFPGYALSNNNANIRRYREQAKAQSRYEAESKAAESGEQKTEFEFPGGSVSLDYSDNRVRIFHDTKPSASKRAELKSRGFRWSPKNKAWQRQLTDAAKHAVSNVTPVPSSELFPKAADPTVETGSVERLRDLVTRAVDQGMNVPKPILDRAGVEGTPKPAVTPGSPAERLRKKSGIQPATLDNAKAKAGDQPGLFKGTGKFRKAPASKIKTRGKGKTQSMFGDLQVNPDQMDMFGGEGTPDELVYQPPAKKKKPVQATLFSADIARRRKKTLKERAQTAFRTLGLRASLEFARKIDPTFTRAGLSSMDDYPNKNDDDDDDDVDVDVDVDVDDDDEPGEMADDAEAGDQPEEFTSADDDGAGDDIETEDNSEASDGLATVSAVLANLSTFGLPLPENTDADNFLDRLNVALEVAIARDEELGDDPELDEATTVTEPQFAAMSLRAKNALAYSEGLHRERLTERLDKLCKSGRCTPADVKRVKKQIGATRLSLGKNGKHVPGDVERWIADRETTIPAGAVWDEREKMKRLSVVDHPNAIEFGEGDDITVEEVEAISKRMVRR